MAMEDKEYAERALFQESLLHQEESTMRQGVIRMISLSDGFGFIEGSSEDVFFRRSAVSGVFFDELEEGQSVKYRLAADDDGRRKKKKRNQGPEAVVVEPLDRDLQDRLA